MIYVGRLLKKYVVNLSLNFLAKYCKSKEKMDEKMGIQTFKLDLIRVTYFII